MVLVLALGFLLVPSSSAQTAEQYRQRALEASCAKSWDDAVANYHHALELDPNHALTGYNLGLALKYKGDARQAVCEFKNAIRLRPTLGDARFGLGAARLDLNDLPAVRKKLLTAALKQQRKDVESHVEFERAFEIAPELRNVARP